MTDPDDLIQRLARNPRDPDLLRQLDKLAWEGFHDPWEQPPGTRPKEAPGEEPMLLDPEPQRLSHGLLREALQVMKRVHTSHPRVGFMIPFNYSQRSDREVTIRIRLEGPRRDILAWQMFADRRVEQARFDAALCLCNDWANRHRWPRPFLDLPATGEDGVPPASGTLRLDHHQPLPDGISPAGLVRLLSSLENAGWDFWAQARSGPGL